MNFRNSVAVSCLTVALAACQAVNMDALLLSQSPPSSALKQRIVAAATDVVYDPYSIRSAEISNVLTVAETPGLQVVCVKANAKNQMGGYTGRKATFIRIMNGQFVGMQSDAPTCHDSRLRYHPFPELENIR